MTKEEAQKTVNIIVAKSIGYMDQGMGHGHYGWVTTSQEDFTKLHEALQVLGAFDKPKTSAGKT